MEKISAFTNSLSQLKALVNLKGINCNYSGGSGAFAFIPEQIQETVVSNLARYLTILSEIEIEFPDFTDSRQMTISALKKLNLTVPAEVLNNLKRDDFVEIYLSDFTPAFKTPNFWATSSYPIDDIFTFPYDELYERDEFFQALIKKSATDVITGKKDIIVNPIPKHIAWEKKGNVKAETTYKYFASAYDQETGSILGAIAVSEVKVFEA